MSKKDAQIKISDYNLVSVSPEQFEQHLDMTLRHGHNIAVFALRGSGKSEMAMSSCKRNGLQPVYLNLSVVERVDLGGFPNMMNSSEYIDYKLPNFFKVLSEEPGKDGPTAVLILDEVDKADSSIEAPLLEIVQFRTINGRPLPNLRAVILTGNLVSEGSKRPSLPLLDRCEAFLLRPDLKSFQTWGSKNNMHPSIMAFLKENEKFLFGEAAEDERYKDTSPRSWHNASKLITAEEAFARTQFRSDSELEQVTTRGRKKKATTVSFTKEQKELLKTKVSAYVGKYVGQQFSLYFDYYADLIPFADQICSGELSKSEIVDKFKAIGKDGRNKQLILGMMIGSRIAYLLDKQTKPAKNATKVVPYSQEDEEYIKNVCTFLDIIEPEDLTLILRSQISHSRIHDHQLDSRPHFKEVIDKIIKMSKR